MKTKLLINTLVHLKPQQIYHQAVAKVYQPPFKLMAAPEVDSVPQIAEPIGKPICCYGDDEFRFVNIHGKFEGWGNKTHGLLWAFNQNYMDWLNQELMLDEDAALWIDRYIADMTENEVGNDPYVTALRCMNWIKLFSKRPQLRTQERDNALYSQCILLEKRLEFRLLGNHLLEELFALFIASVYFKQEQWSEKSRRLMMVQLDEQILNDGAHYELSAMYHCILLDRLLDCVNFSSTTDYADFTNGLKGFAMKMLGHLESIVWADGSIPLLNDAAIGIAPLPQQIFDYAQRLGIGWQAIPLRRCGYRKMGKGRMEAVVDISPVRATYQPGHTHADFFTYELRIDGKPFIVDTGTSTYDKGPRRDYERSTRAHNTVTVDGKDSCEVWSGFRVGKRPKIHIAADCDDEIQAWHKGFGKGLMHTRNFTMRPDYFKVSDKVSKARENISYIHFAEGVKVSVDDDNYGIKTNAANIHIDGATRIEIEEETYSEQYNMMMKCKVAAIRFDKRMEYIIEAI